ncbi:hypothetical protein [Tolypothrix sp. VBCCA 56010]
MGNGQWERENKVKSFSHAHLDDAPCPMPHAHLDDAPCPITHYPIFT